MRIQAPSRKTAIYLVLIAAAVGVWEAARRSDANYEVDWENVTRLISEPFTPVPVIDELRVVVAGPMTGFDSYRSVPSLLRARPIIESRDEEIIDAVVRDLRDNRPGQFRSPRGPGYTYHVLLLEKRAKRAMHFRIFATSLTDDGVAPVYPRSETGFGYANGKILRRLRQLAGEESSGKK